MKEKTVITLFSIMLVSIIVLGTNVFKFYNENQSLKQKLVEEQEKNEQITSQIEDIYEKIDEMNDNLPK